MSVFEVRDDPWSSSVCCELLYSVALWHGDQAALYRAITANRAAANTLSLTVEIRMYRSLLI